MSQGEGKIPANAEGEATEPALKQQQQQQKKPPKVEPHVASTDLQHLVNTLSQALKQSIVTSIKARRNIRAPRIYSVGQSFKTWLSQFMHICLHYRTNRPTKL